MGPDFICKSATDWDHDRRDIWGRIRLGISTGIFKVAYSTARHRVLQTATLTLLALIVGFSFSMATTRYDLRKNYEEAEAKAIGAEYVRAGLLPASNAGAVRAQLRKYIDLRILFYRTRSGRELQQIDVDTAQLQAEMWSAVQAPALAQPTQVIAQVASGMNDVLNSQGYTQAAWWNRIPTSAWSLMIAIAICCNLLVGYGASTAQVKSRLLFVLPWLSPSRSF